MYAWKLPTSLNVGGKNYKIRTDYRVILDILAAMNDPDIFDYPREFEEVHLESGRLSQIIFVVILLLMILNVFIQR